MLLLALVACAPSPAYNCSFTNQPPRLPPLVALQVISMAKMMREQNAWLEERHEAAAKLQACTRNHQKRKKACSLRMSGSKLGGYSAPAPKAETQAAPAAKSTAAKAYVGKGATPAVAAVTPARTGGYVGKSATPTPMPAKDALAPANNSAEPKPKLIARDDGDGTVEQRSNPMMEARRAAATGGAAGVGVAATGADSPLKAKMDAKKMGSLTAQKRPSTTARNAILGGRGRGRGGRGRGRPNKAAT